MGMGMGMGSFFPKWCDKKSKSVKHEILETKVIS